MRISVNRIEFDGSLVNGPGIRSLLFLQGCDRYCDGCHNRDTWDISKGTYYETAELADIIRVKSYNKKLTITGGEPLYQRDALLELLTMLDDFDLCLYTSYELFEVPTDIRDKIDYLKTGRYEKEHRTTTTPYLGSTNQQFIKMKRTK